MKLSQSHTFSTALITPLIKRMQLPDSFQEIVREFYFPLAQIIVDKIESRKKGRVFAGTPKGKTIHRKFGLIFFYSMILSGIMAMIVAVLPKHESPFLFAVGIFSLYFVRVGST